MIPKTGSKTTPSLDEPGANPTDRSTRNLESLDKDYLFSSFMQTVKPRW